MQLVALDIFQAIEQRFLMLLDRAFYHFLFFFFTKANYEMICIFLVDNKSEWLW